MVTTDKKSLVAETLFAQLIIFLSVLPDFAFLNSEITLVSNRDTMKNLQADTVLYPVVAVQTQLPLRLASQVIREYFLCYL